MFPRPTGKKPSLEQALAVLEQLHGRPVHPEHPDDPLLDHLLVAVLSLHCGAAKAREALRAISASYLDLNEVRVSGLGEIQRVLEPFVPAERIKQTASDLRMALQDVYDGTHGLDLEPLRGRDPEDLKHFCTRLPNTAGGPVAHLFQIAVGEKHLALGSLESHLLDRLGLLPRAATPVRVRQALERHVKPADRERFAWVTGASARLFEKDFDPQHPFCQLLVECRAKELVERERQRKAEEVRRKADEKRRAIEEVQRARLEAIARKKREAEDKKKAAEAEKKRKKDDAIKAVAAKKAAEKAQLAEAKRKKEEAARAVRAAEAARKAADVAAKQAAAAAAKKAAEASKAAAIKLAKKVAAQKVAAQKAAAQKAAAQKAAALKAAALKAAAQKAAAQKAAALKAAAQKAAGQKAAAQEAAAQKAAAQKAAAQKAAAQKAAAQKAATKKAASGSKAAPTKAAAKKTPGRRR